MTLQKPDNEACSYDERSEDFGYMVETASELDLPDGFSAEVFGGNIVVSPWSRGSYFRPMNSLLNQLEPHAPESHVTSGAPFKFVFPNHAAAVGPDVWVADEDMIEIDSSKLPGEALSLVAELTSPSTRGRDLTTKADLYGHAGVPVYLLFDMKEQRCTVYSEPSSRYGYQSLVAVEFGKPVQVPEPFGFELDTSAFKRQR
ncbi:Uma2 family endonuclease [Glycomyces tenuis]|nr:Uma2 family endonuclease [Glycomyces tenuis]